MLGVEQERTAVFKPPPELLARAKKAQRAAAEAAAAKAPAADRSEVPTAPPPPEASVPTARPPAPQPAESSGDGWSELFEPALAALKPIAPRPVSARKSAPELDARKSAPDVEARKSRPDAESRKSRPEVDARKSAPEVESRKSAPELAPASSERAAANPTPLAPAASQPPASIPGLQVAAPPAFVLPSVESEPLDEPTLLRIAPRTAEPTSERRATPEPLEISEAPSPALVAPSIEAFAPAPEPAEPERVVSIAPAADGNASGRRWLVIAAVFLLVVVVALAAVSH